MFDHQNHLPEKSFRFLVFGAHPDDCDLLFGASAVRLTRAGHVVKFVSATNGDRGHQSMSGADLAERRRRETCNAAKTAGIAEYQVLDISDCTLEPTLALRETVTRIIRSFVPDVVLTHRSCSYHPDHRAIGQAVDDASYICCVPLYCPDTPVPEQLHPEFAYLYDPFDTPNPFVPDAAVAVDPAADQKAEMVCCHESQMFEWLPWIQRIRDFDASGMDHAARMKYVTENYMQRDLRQAEAAADVLEEMYGNAGRSVRRAETFMLAGVRSAERRRQFQEYFKL